MVSIFIILIMVVISQAYAYVKTIELHILNMCHLLHVNYIPIKILFKKLIVSSFNWALNNVLIILCFLSSSIPSNSYFKLFLLSLSLLSNTPHSPCFFPFPLLFSLPLPLFLSGDQPSNSSLSLLQSVLHLWSQNKLYTRIPDIISSSESFIGFPQKKKYPNSLI